MWRLLPLHRALPGRSNASACRNIPSCCFDSRSRRPGIAHFFAMEMGGSVCMPARLYLFGSQAPATAAREEPLWQAWISRQFPAAPTANPVVQESS